MRLQTPMVFKIDAAIEHIAHWLPAQGPLKDFIHHNTLHSVQHHPFHEGVAIAAKINGDVVDLSTILKNGDSIKILTSKDIETLDILRHSTAHVMAQAVQRIYPNAKIAIGPTIENGFYYDFDIPDTSLSADDLSKIEEQMNIIIKENQTFERHEILNVQEQKLLKYQSFFPY